MRSRITITDLDRPKESLEVELVASDKQGLTLAVPNTLVQFRMSRRGPSDFYVGSLGGRSYYFNPPPGDEVLLGSSLRLD